MVEERLHIRIRRRLLNEYSVLTLFAVVIGVLAGLAALGFRYLLWLFQSVFHNGGALYGRPWADASIFNFDATFFYQAAPLGARLWLLFVIPLAGLLVGLITYRLAPEARGAGTPQTMEAVLAHGSRIRGRVAGLKALASALTIGSGGSAGREGPIVQIGAALGSGLAQRFRMSETRRRILLGCGAAGAIAATFNAPIAGVLFALELILLEFRTRSFIPLVVSSVFATATIGLFIPSGPAFEAEYIFKSPLELPFFLLLGLIAGFVALVWIELRYRIEDVFDALRVHPILKPAVGGAVVAALAVFFPEIMGVGYEMIGTVLSSGFQAQIGYVTVTVLLALAFFKIVATATTLGSGGSGGGFAPSLFIGAMVGGAYGFLVNSAYPDITNPYGAYALVGMAALFAGASRGTLTAIVIVFELTGDYKFILPLMFACVVSDAVTLVFKEDTIYTAALRRKGIPYEHDMEVFLLELVPVERAMVRKVATVSEDDPVSKVASQIILTGYQAYPVLDKDGRLVGILSASDVRRAMTAGQGEAKVRDVETKDLVVVHPRTTLAEAMERMALRDIGHLPVVDPADPHRLVGLVTRSDVIRAYKQRAMEDLADG
jgi:CIC family chloride channel protein